MHSYFKSLEFQFLCIGQETQHMTHPFLTIFLKIVNHFLQSELAQTNARPIETIQTNNQPMEKVQSENPTEKVTAVYYMWRKWRKFRLSPAGRNTQLISVYYVQNLSRIGKSAERYGYGYRNTSSFVTT